MKVMGVLISVLVAAAIAGCGGGDGSDTSSVTKAEFVKQAGKICKETAERQYDAVFALFKEQRERGQPSERELQEQTEEVLTEVTVPGYERLADELARLRAPVNGSDQVDAIIAAYREAIREAKSDPASVVDGKANPFAQPRKLALAYGVKDCREV